MIALENDAWGSVGVYFLFTDASDALLLTKTPDPTGMPAWSPRGYEMAVASNRDGKFRVYVLEGLKDYVDRLNAPPQIRTFEPLPEQ